MSMVTVSAKRNRVYARKFDHEEAKRLHERGMSIAAIAEKLGASHSGVKRVVDPVYRELLAARTRSYVRSGSCPDCGTQTTYHRDGDSRCVKCAAKLRSKVDEEQGLAYCPKCKQWLPVEDFPRASSRAARGLHGECRACGSARRRDYRERRKVPCVQCGAPCLPASEKGARGRDTGLCRACWHASRRVA